MKLATRGGSRAHPRGLLPRAALLTVLPLLANACASPIRPEPGHGELSGILEDDWQEIYAHGRFDEHLEQRLSSDPDQSRGQLLVLSGGGQNGAFGAGLLEAWPQAGATEGEGDWPARPVFDAVTGVSTGALLATSAFLDDPELNSEVAHLYSNLTDDAVFRTNSVFGLLSKTGIARYEGLTELLEGVLTDEVIDRVGAAYAQGRTLWVGTTNLDRGVFQSWPLTYIASRGQDHPDFYRLYREVILASASIPVAIEVRYIHGEMHVDGATIDNAFIPALAAQLAPMMSRRGIDIYVINNGKLSSRQMITEPKLLSVAARSLEVSTDAGAYKSLLRMRGQVATTVLRYDADPGLVGLRFAFIPDGYPEPPEGVAFDLEYVQGLVEFGRSFAREGRWAHELPSEASTLD